MSLNIGFHNEMIGSIPSQNRGNLENIPQECIGWIEAFGWVCLVFAVMSEAAVAFALLTVRRVLVATNRRPHQCSVPASVRHNSSQLASSIA